MLMIIGTDENNLESQVAKRFGHANYLILFNMETKTFKSFANNNEGHNHDNLQEYLDKGVRVFIVGNIGPHAFDILKSGGCKIYLARKMKGAQAVELFSKGELKELNEPTAKNSIGQRKHEHENGN
jgi:predicted Fe-Mo cluster-binding NifX family protein